MALIRNNNATALQIGGVVVPARGEAEVPTWEAVVGRSRVVQSWVKVGILQVVQTLAVVPPKAEPEALEELPPEPAQEAAEPDESTERAELFAALSELGIKAGGRTGTEKLRAMLAEARG